MRVATLGSGAVGGYYGARLAVAGHEVAFLARGAHLEAIRARGLELRSPLGDVVAVGRAEDDPGRIGPVDLVIVAVKTYDNDTALKLLPRMMGPSTAVLSLQNGVDSVEEIAAVVGEASVLGGSAYVATAVTAPGVIEQTGVHHKIAFGEVFGDRRELTARVEQIRDALVGASIEVEVSADARVLLWEKLIYLAPFAGFTGSTRLPIGSTRDDPDIRARFFEAVDEVERLARAEGVDVATDTRQRISGYIDSITASTRSSLLIDLSQGKRIEVDALLGSVVRRTLDSNVPTPIMTMLYAILKPHAAGT